MKKRGDFLYSLAVDVGTQRMKVLLFDTEGNIVEKSVYEYNPPYFSKKLGWAEYNPEDYWKIFINMAKNVVKGRESEVKVITVTTQRDSLVFVDKQGKPLRPAILWLDHRTADFDLKLPLYEELFYRIIGKWRTIKNVYKGAKVNWVRQNEPHVWKNSYKILQISGFFNYMLTERFADSVASQVGHIPFDYKNGTWCKKSDIKAKLFPIPYEKLPELVKPGEIIGELKKEVKDELKINALVVAGGSDKACETLGLGVVNDEEVSLSLSTTATVETTTKKYFETLPHIPPYPGIIPGTYNPEVEIFRGFWLVRWFRDEFAHYEKELSKNSGKSVEEHINELLHKAPAGSFGLVTQPFWTPGLDNPEARGAIIGFSSFHKREHVYRSIIEGLFYALREGMEKIQKRGRLNFKAVKVGGGASRSDEIVKIGASVFKMPFYRTKVEETAGLGASIVGFYGVGVYKSILEAVKNMVKIEGPFLPDENDSEVYDYIYNKIYKKIYSKLVHLYKEMENRLKTIV